MRLGYLVTLICGILLISGAPLVSAVELEEAPDIEIVKAVHNAGACTYLQNGTASCRWVQQNITTQIQRIADRGITTFSVRPLQGGIFSLRGLVYPFAVNKTFNRGASKVVYTTGSKPVVTLLIRDGCWFNLKRAEVSCNARTWGNA